MPIPSRGGSTCRCINGVMLGHGLDTTIRATQKPRSTSCTKLVFNTSPECPIAAVFPQLFTKAQENTRYAENRPRRVVVACLQGGKPSNNLLVQDSQKRRNTFSKKVHVFLMDKLSIIVSHKLTTPFCPARVFYDCLAPYPLLFVPLPCCTARVL